MNKNIKKQTLAMICAAAAMATVVMAAPSTGHDFKKAVPHSTKRHQAKKSDRITAYRIEHKNNIDILFATIGGREKLIARDIHDPQIIENGNAIVWAWYTRSGFEGSIEALCRFDAQTGRKKELFVSDNGTGISDLREVKGKSGRSAVVLTMSDEVIGYPILILVDPQRGGTWEQEGALLTGVRNGRLAIAVYRRSDIINNEGNLLRTRRPEQMLYPDIDALRQRPVLKRTSH
jgi:hypothetical protein